MPPASRRKEDVAFFDNSNVFNYICDLLDRVNSYAHCLAYKRSQIRLDRGGASHEGRHNGRSDCNYSH